MGEDKMENNLVVETKREIQLKKVLEDLQGGEEETLKGDLEGESQELQGATDVTKWGIQPQSSLTSKGIRQREELL